MADIGIRRDLSLDYDTALQRVPAALKEEGFGVLTQIDVKETLKAKIGVDFRRYMIMGACNPTLAHQALQTEVDIGVFLPCNVVVYENDDGKATVVVIDPVKTIGAAGVSSLAGVAETVQQKLRRVVDALA